MSIRGKTFLPRYDVPMVYRKYEKDINSDDPWDNGEAIVLVPTKVVAENCTIQTPTKNNTDVELQGLDTTTMVIIYTNTFVPQPSDGTDDLPAAFYIPSAFFTTNPSYPSTRGGWYKVKSVQEKLNRVVSHYKVCAVKDDNINVDEYPDTSAFDAAVTTRDEFLSGTWGSVWQ